MRIKPVGTSLVIELIEPAKRESGLVIRKQEETVFTGEIIEISKHLEQGFVKHGGIKQGDTIIFVGHCVDTPIDSQYIIDAEQIIGVLYFDEEGY